MRLTSDEVPVLYHGAKFRRLPVAVTPQSQVPELPLLEAVLQRYSRIAFLNIELKVPGAEPQLIELLAKYPPAKGVLVSSFLPEVLRSLKPLQPTLPLGLICSSRRQLQRWRESSVDCVVAHQTLASRQLINKVHESGKKLLVWTVNRPSAMLRFADWGADGLITDRTDLLARTFGRA